MITPPQVPPPGETFLDHVGWFVPDMAAARAFEQMGFVLTPYAEHGNSAADGSRVPSGTANRCAMLPRGYLEILAPVAGSDAALAQQLRAGLARYQGAHLIALSCADAEVERARLAGAGFDPQPVVRLRRPLALAGGPEGVAAFSVVRTAAERMPEGRIQFLVQETPELVWQQRFLPPDNAVEALTGVLLAVADVAEVAARYALFTGRAARNLGRSGALICLERGQMAFVQPDALPLDVGAAFPAPPFFAAVALRSGDLAVTRAYLARRGVRFISAADHLVVYRDDAAGTALVIHAEGADERLYAR